MNDVQNPSASLEGLSTEEAARRLERVGPNALPEPERSGWRDLLSKLSAPVPWMLEATIALQLVLRKFDEALVIAALLLINAAIGFLQERRADRSLALLRQRLQVTARVRRDGRWQSVPARDVVPGDALHVRVGDFVPADMRIDSGRVLLDQSTLTGESLPVEAAAPAVTYAGSIVRRGEATGEVTATGTNSYFGKAGELVRIAKAASHLTDLILGIVKALVAFDVVLVLGLFLFAVHTSLPLHELLPFALMLLVASVPVALPATFTLASALGAQQLAHRGVLVTRLTALEDAASMDVLATDKTGTLTQNLLKLAALEPVAGRDASELLRLAALACDEATQDPIDLAILAAAQERGLLSGLPSRIASIPFDPSTRVAEATYVQGGQLRVVKGAPEAVAALAGGAHAARIEERLAQGGYRVLAVAAGAPDALKPIGLVALEDPPRADAADLVRSLRALGVRVLMVTGDGLATAQAVATRLGLGTRACDPARLRDTKADPSSDCDLFARVLPQDKHALVRQLQTAGHIVGMTGDGVNDAAALKQAEVGIAVASATDVAKAAASLVLTDAGLANAVAAIEVSRQVHRRLLTYTLNKIVKTIVIAVFLAGGVLLTRAFVVTPMLIVLLLFTNDFVTMALAADRADAAARPARWRIATLLKAAVPIAVAVLVLAFAVLLAAREVLHLPLEQQQTLAFLLLVFTGQGLVYLLRTERYLWASRPGGWLLLASAADIVIVLFLAWRGVLMAPLPPAILFGLLAVVALFLLLLDVVKVRFLRT